MFAAIILLFSVFAAAEDAIVLDAVDVNESLIRLAVRILEYVDDKFGLLTSFNSQYEVPSFQRMIAFAEPLPL